MKKLLVLAGVVLLSGCWQSTRIYELDAAEKICAQHGGISELTIWWSGDSTVMCRNLASYRVNASNVERSK